jgi:dihydroorotate dehydrogenase
MGEATHDELDVATLGGVVVGPLSRRSRAGSETPRIAEVPGGIVLESGGQNRGLDAAIKHFGALWGRSPVPVIVQVIDNDARMLAEIAARLASVQGVGGIEWMPPARTDLRTLRVAIENMAQEGDLPLLVRIPLGRTQEWGKVAVEAGADALTISTPPEAAALHRNTDGSTTLVTGSLFGPAVFPLMLAALVEAKGAGWGVPLVASGGIHTVEQARIALDAGATAIQIDVAAWVEPTLPGQIAAAL